MLGKLLVVTAVVTAALTVPATAALADHGHHDRSRHAHGHHVPWFRPHCPPVTARPAAPARRPAPPPKTHRVPVPVRVVAVTHSEPVAATTPSATPPTLVVGTPAAAAAPAPVSWAGALPALAGAAVVVTLIGLGFSVRRGLARVE